MGGYVPKGPVSTADVKKKDKLIKSIKTYLNLSKMEHKINFLRKREGNLRTLFGRIDPERDILKRMERLLVRIIIRVIEMKRAKQKLN